MIMVVEQPAQQILLTAYHLSPGSPAAQGHLWCLSEELFSEVGKSADHKNELATLLPGPQGHQQALVALTNLPRNPHPHPQPTSLQVYLSSGLSIQSWPKLCHGWSYAQPFLLMSKLTGWSSWMDLILFMVKPCLLGGHIVNLLPHPTWDHGQSLSRPCLGAVGLHPITEGTPHPGLTLDSHLITPRGEPRFCCSLTPIVPHNKRDKQKQSCSKNNSLKVCEEHIDFLTRK